MQLNACYYPYSRFDDLESLKRACVIFDTVRLLEPNPVDLLMTPEWDRKHLKARTAAAASRATRHQFRIRFRHAIVDDRGGDERSS
jgi:hypothetical protein